MSDDRGIGDNLPPPEKSDEAKLREALDQRFTPLSDRLGDLEIEAIGLPTQPKNDEDVAKVNAWVTKARALRRDVERFHDDEKQPWLLRGRWVDDYTKGTVADLNRRATDVEARNTAYLIAKRAAEEDLRRREAEAARREAAEKQRLAEEQAAEARRLEKEAEEARERLHAATTMAEHDAATADLQEAAQGVQEATQAAKEAEKEAAATTKDAARQERAVERGGLDKTRGGGGQASVVKERRWRWSSPMKLKASLGVLGDYFTEDQVVVAIEKAMRETSQPTIPGVEWYEEEVAKTRAVRT